MASTTFDIRAFGAIGDAQTICSGAFSKAIEAATRQGGGTVVVSGGTYLTGPIHLKSNIELHIDSGAVVLFSDDMTLYDPVPTRWEGVECYGYSPLIYGYKLENVSITGRGSLDGQGRAWWEERRRRVRERVGEPVTDLDKRLAQLNPDYRSAGGGGGGRESQFLRPPLVQLVHCSNVLLQGITCRNSPFWNTHLVYCENARINGVVFRNPQKTPNGDGLDIDSCKGVAVSDCFFDVGDDCLCLKSGCDEDGRRVGRACEDIVVSNCVMLRGHGGVVFGSEGAAGIRNVSIDNCIFRGTDRGVRFKTRRGRGGVTEDIRISNIIMQDVNCPVVMNMMYVCGIPAEQRDAYFGKRGNPVDQLTPQLRNINISNITARNTSAAAAVLLGLPEMPISGVTFDNIVISMNPSAAQTLPAMAYGMGKMKGAGFIARNVSDLLLRNITIEHTIGPVLLLQGSRTVAVAGLSARPDHAEAAVSLRDCQDVVIRDSRCGQCVAGLVTAAVNCDGFVVNGNTHDSF